jgi:hypothetical protein
MAKGFKEVFGEALKVPVLKRPDYISEACRDSEEVLSEVSKLLSSFDDEYMNVSAVVQVAELIEREQLEVGETISHYKIEAHLGSGGMGDVLSCGRPAVEPPGRGKGPSRPILHSTCRREGG